ncbi:MAG: restriction endonuclease-like protein [Firmicutes bacterium]|nr:restriction endonuclease-like protein [Bacillota bacterium]
MTYQRFVFLKSLLADGTLDAAIHQILTSPHRAWVPTEEWRRPGQHLPASAGVVRQLGAAGPRLLWPDAPSHLPMQSLPEKFQVRRTKETLDTPENRFVKFALLRWQELAVQIYEALAQEAPRYPVQRGLREVQGLLDFLDTFLAAKLFQEVGSLTFLPANSQVLQKRAGYRDVFRIFLQVEAAALLAWEGGEAVYGAGQRDVAALYEAWAFLQLAQIVSRFCHVPFDLASLIETRPDGLGVNLKQGTHKVLRGTLERLGRTLEVELWYNRTFGPASSGSWTRPMRPDCSLWIRPQGAPPQVPGVWLHFDAKYRVDSLVELFGAAPAASEADPELDERIPTVDGKGGPTRDDLLKMHAYRDAIRRTAGAYILYPGTENQQFTVYHELLPGLGAFVLRPTEAGAAAGQECLAEFLDAVFTHVASQVTHYERWRYWTQAIYQTPPALRTAVPALPDLPRPPADTLVLLGYVRDNDHLHWIRTNHLYELAVDERTGRLGLTARELAVDFVLLYGPPLTEGELWQVAGEPRLLTGQQVVELGYPYTPGALYFCLPLRPLPTRLLPSLAPQRVETLRKQSWPGVPAQETVVITMWELMVGTDVTDTGTGA